MTNITFDDLDEGTRQVMTASGRGKLEWASSRMVVLERLGSEIRERGHLSGKRIAMSLHPEAKTGVLALTLARAGAHVRLTTCNPLSTDDEVSLALVKFDVSPGTLEVRARKGIARDEYYSALNWALDMSPQIVIDDGGDLVRLLHTERRDLLKDVLGGCEETTTGIHRLKAMAAEGRLEFPMMDVNDCAMKHLFDNRYGTGQSTLDGIMTATNLCIAGMEAVVAGYGWCGKGIAMRLKGMGAIVTVTEVDPVKAVEAVMDGFRVRRMEDASRTASLIITATGCCDIVGENIIKCLPDGCILANSGHFDNEIDVSYLRRTAVSVKRSRRHVEDLHMPDGRRLHLLSEGRLVNLAAGQGHPVEIMDMSFAIQAAGAELIAIDGSKLPKDVVPFPEELDRRIAVLKLSAMGHSIDVLTSEQERYLTSWEDGT